MADKERLQALQASFTNLLGKYDLGIGRVPETPDASSTRVAGFLNEDGRAKLYAGCSDKDSITARTIFLQQLSTRLSTLHPNASSNRRIKLRDLLGSKELVELYKKAVAEERRSKAFRDAVFLRSMRPSTICAPPGQHVVLWIAGPSSSGKTFATDAVIKQIEPYMAREYPVRDHPMSQQNNVIISDGSISREMSQMRQSLLLLALALGYEGIEDLEKETPIKFKDEIADAVLTGSNLHLAIPCTFTDPRHRDRLCDYTTRTDTIPMFSQVECDQDTASYSGQSRAWMSRDKLSSVDFKCNNCAIGCESKKYEGNFFWGTVLSSYARRLFCSKCNSCHKPPVTFKITNDSIYIIKDPKTGKWRKCKTMEEAGSEKSLRVTKRQFNLIPDNGVSMDRQRLEAWLNAYSRSNTNPTKPLITCSIRDSRVDLESTPPITTWSPTLTFTSPKPNETSTTVPSTHKPPASPPPSEPQRRQ